MTNPMRIGVFCLLVACHSIRADASESWTQFRGPDASGICTNPNVSLTTDPTAGAVWRTETPGRGWSSPVTDGKVIWLTSARVTEATEQQRAAALANVQLADMKDVAGSVELLAIALDGTTGRVLHEIDLDTVSQPKPIHPMNGYASPTPVLAGDRVVVDFGQYGTWCLDKVSGQTIWQRRLVVDDSVGPGSSPVVHRDHVILTRDGMDQQYIAALSLADGATVWKTDRPTIDAPSGEQRKAYSTPLLVNLDGITQAIIPGSQWCVAYNAETGEEIWRVEHGTGFSVTPMATLADDRVIFSTGFMRAEVVAVDPTGRGDVTDSHIVWRARQGGPRMSSMVHDGARLYAVNDDGILTVLRLEDGSKVYRERLAGKFSASPFRVGEKIWLANHDGQVTVLQAGDQFEPIVSYSFDEQIMASPGVIGDDLLVRTAEAVYRLSSNHKGGQSGTNR